jgi:hypothetical protein
MELVPHFFPFPSQLEMILRKTEKRKEKKTIPLSVVVLACWKGADA